MSVLVHLCVECAHGVSWHEPREQAYTSCRCCRQGAPAAAAEPILRETYTVPGWVAEPLYPPGSTRNVGNMHMTTCCDCDRCHAAHASLTASNDAGQPA